MMPRAKTIWVVIASFMLVWSQGVFGLRSFGSDHADSAACRCCQAKSCCPAPLPASFPALFPGAPLPAQTREAEDALPAPTLLPALPAAPECLAPPPCPNPQAAASPLYERFCVLLI